MERILKFVGVEEITRNRFKGMVCQIFYLSLLMILGLSATTYADSDSMVDPNWKGYARVSGISGNVNSIGSD
ncbi:MAG: hypothetical protein R3351_08685, partial [Nitrospirales bacterium]|nr:hypothetical protein [Nitrospirales bacterium]